MSDQPFVVVYFNANNDVVVEVNGRSALFSTTEDGEVDVDTSFSSHHYDDVRAVWSSE